MQAVVVQLYDLMVLVPVAMTMRMRQRRTRRRVVPITRQRIGQAGEIHDIVDYGNVASPYSNFLK